MSDPVLDALKDSPSLHPIVHVRMPDGTLASFPVDAWVGGLLATLKPHELEKVVKAAEKVTHSMISATPFARLPDVEIAQIRGGD
ncbi:hypothetical protein CMI37_31360 [Candidatus Pacearchaeota archaeon]|nr:hypothetical protein [Candidatus Pacearchaeota archaeon]|tara:strand:+ start:2482 stop:2736 length:255 start_codon:yes stop_codon:yes gene_type:complete